MKKTICALLMILFLCGCAATNSANPANQSQQSKNNSSLPASENAAVIKDIKYPEVYHAKSDAELMDVVKLFICDFDLIFSNTEFSSTKELGDDIFYYLTSLLHHNQFFESQEINDTVDENYVFFYKQETIEKYAYYFFNYKIDCAKIDGWSEEKQGVYRLMEGFGGGRADPICDLKELEPGKYQFTAVYIHGEEFNGATDYKITAILGVEQNRVYLISLKREDIN